MKEIGLLKNYLIILKLIYCMLLLPSPHRNMIKEMPALLYEFIRKGKGERSTRITLIRDYNQGGFRMPHLESQIKAIKMSYEVRDKEIE